MVLPDMSFFDRALVNRGYRPPQEGPALVGAGGDGVTGRDGRHPWDDVEWRRYYLP